MVADLAELQCQGLDPTAIGWRPDGPGDAAWQLAVIADWARAWRLTGGDRTALAQRGYRLPPVEPDCGPEQDWLLFERWMAGEPLTWRYEERFGPLPPAESLSDAEIDARLAEMALRLAAQSVDLSLAERLPARRRYAWLRAELRARPIEFLAGGTRLVIDGCTGDCEGCFQQEWCEIAELED
jgi:hypothetical protein